MRLKWALVVAAVFLMVTVAAVTLLVQQARADTGTGGPTAAVMVDTWSVIAGPVSEGGDVVGYNIYVFQESTAMLWAWEHGSERELLRVPTRDQYEREPNISGSSRPRGAVR